MTDKLKCPFCGTEFDIMKGISDSVLGCPKCKHIATIGVWEALINGKCDSFWDNKGYRSRFNAKGSDVEKQEK